MRTFLILVTLPLLVRAGDAPKSLGEATAILEQAMADGDINTITGALVDMPQLYKKAEEPDQKAAIALIGKGAKSKDLRVRHGAFAALGAIRAKGSSKYLKKWLSPPKRFKGEIPPSYNAAIRAAGSIADVATLSQLKKISNHSTLPIATKATEALGGYSTLPTKRRKGLAFDLVKRLRLLSAPPGRRGGWRADERIRKASLAAATIKALRAITGKTYATSDGWQNWMNRAEKQRNPFQ